MKKVLDMFHSDYFSLPPARSVSGFFLNLYCENLFSFLEVNLMRVWDSLQTWCPEISYSHTRPCSVSSSFSKRLLSVLTSLWFPWLLLQVSRSWLCLFEWICLSGFQVGGLSCHLISLMGPRIVLIFSLSSLLFF